MHPLECVPADFRLGPEAIVCTELWQNGIYIIGFWGTLSSVNLKGNYSKIVILIRPGGIKPIFTDKKIYREKSKIENRHSLRPK